MAPISASAVRLPAPRRKTTARGKQAEVDIIIRDLASVADYITGLKREIGALRANEVCSDRIPGAQKELAGVVSASAEAANQIMAAAEGILAAPGSSLEAYRGEVESRVVAIFEACAFQDIAGQRLTRVRETLAQVEKRLTRFSAAVDIREAPPELDPEDVLEQARRDVLMLHGPQEKGVAVDQDEIDQLFG